MMRAMVSVLPPGGKVTISRTGRDGQAPGACAPAVPIENASAARTTRRSKVRMLFSSLSHLQPKC